MYCNHQYIKSGNSHCCLKNRVYKCNYKRRFISYTFVSIYEIQHVHGTESRRKVLSCKSVRPARV
uniref:Uncharacterized protein n=1 Tax=Aegilops tauschii subsp. strangulata TaxID=200361 RepID=A0A453FV11_AEGTS